LQLFLIWSLLLIGGFCLFFLILHRKNKLYNRFRIRLNIILLLFTLLPTLPILFLSAHLITRSARVIVIPGLENTLRVSLDTIRSQIEADGITFFRMFPDPDSWNKVNMTKFKIKTLVSYNLNNDKLTKNWCLNTDTCFQLKSWQPTINRLDNGNLNQTGLIVNLAGRAAVIVSGGATDSSLVLAVFPLNEDAAASKEDILHTLRLYSTISLLKETVIEKQIIWTLAFLFILALSFVASFAARKIAAGINQPVQDLVRGMALVADGKLNVQVENKAKDEFSYLIDRFNIMTRDIETGREKLVTALRMAAWQQVARQISHEIKNSLTPVFISLHRFKNLFSGQDLPEKVPESLQTIEEELRSMELLASEFSRFAKMPKPQKEILNLNDLVTTVCISLKSTLAPTEIHAELLSAPARIYADWEQLRRVLINLLKNSAEANIDNQTIQIKITTSDNQRFPLLLTIQDFGCGMTEEVKNKMFEPYFTSKKSGTGLGLAIVKQIIIEHNFQIAVDSSLNTGTTISLKFPSPKSINEEKHV